MISRRQFCKATGAGAIAACLPQSSFATDQSIKIFGIGGAGGNALDYMIQEKVTGVQFICVNTDAEALKRSSAPIKLQLGSGSGVSGNPKTAYELALTQRDRFAEVLDGSQLAFITAGLGGGTGSGVAPVLAGVARKMGIPTVAVVTSPFEFEGRRRQVAKRWLQELGLHADSLIVRSNEKLLETMGEDISLADAFRYIDNEIMAAIECVINRCGELM